MYLLIVFSFILWYSFILVLFAGWKRSLNRIVHMPEAENLPMISVVVPVRNEAHNLPSLFQDLIRQRQPAHEIILADDHSSDDTLLLCRQFAEINPSVRWVQPQSGCEGKKAALSAGIAAATGDIILTTDADCRLPESWIRAMTACFRQNDTLFVAGPVLLTGSSLLQRLLGLEQLALQAVAAASFGLNRPVFCSGANLAFRKPAFLQAGGYSANLHIPSGDDVFLMQRIKQKCDGNLLFCNSPAATVLTSPPETWTHLISQRIRWAGKWKALGVGTTALAFFVFLFHVLLLTFPVWAMSWVITLPQVLGLVFIKWMLEFILLSRVARGLGTAFSAADFLCAQFLFPLYVVLAGILALKKKTLWKGRIINTR
ncbi:MAG: glycosyl transferase [Cyclobacteriaceae bacterium]|nr:MAG: glycosyl transferase [Cyclobacteriaceae bacterium]